LPDDFPVAARRCWGQTPESNGTSIIPGTIINVNI
jgi:hypothetical protein